MEPSRPENIHAQIAIRAYQRWEKRGRPIGSPEEDWVQAEEELRVLLDVAETSLFIDGREGNQ